MKSVFFLIIFITLVFGSHAEITAGPTGDYDAGDPLYLTPYIKKGNILEARDLSRVGDLPGLETQLPSYSGFITVDKKYKSNLFFWFFPANNGNPDAPVVLWLQGGPGGSGLFGLFVDHGPYFVDSNIQIHPREDFLSMTYHVIYIDNPVGTGFSHTDSEAGYSNSENMLSKNLYKFLQQFFIMFKEYSKNDFYIAGESYGGKYTSTLAYKLHQERNTSGINFRGVSIGNGYLDPETMTNPGTHLYELGLVDRNMRATLNNLSDSMIAQVKEVTEGGIPTADKERKLFHDLLTFQHLFMDCSGFDSFYNLLFTHTHDSYNNYKKYVQSKQFRKAVHVGSLKFHVGIDVKWHLLFDSYKTVKPELTEVMKHYRVLLYYGQLDLLFPYPYGVNLLYSIDWPYSDDFKSSNRTIWQLNNSDYIAGYNNEVTNFCQVLVRNAGHFVFHDQEVAGLELVRKFIDEYICT